MDRNCEKIAFDSASACAHDLLMNAPMKIAYSKREAAHLLGLSERLVDQLLSAQKIASVRVGRRVLVPHEALIGFLDQATKERGRRTGQ
jgi:excisionase family DNA binding protein